MAAVPEAGYRAAVHCLAGFDQQAALADIRTPTLLIAGEKDPVAPPRVMQRMAKAMPDGRFETIQGSGHLVHLERPEAFNCLLGKFLKSQVIH